MFIKTDQQEELLTRLEPLLQKISNRSHELEESRDFPFENIEDLVRIGYSSWTLPKHEGGMGLGLYDFLLCQEKIAEACGPTSLSIGWHSGIVMQLQENRDWEAGILHETFQRIKKGALINRAATEPATGSPTRGGVPSTHAHKVQDGWIITGRKTYTSLAPMLDLFIVNAWITEENRMGWFLVDRIQPGVSIEKTWDVISMQGTGSEDLILDGVIIEDKFLVEEPKGMEKKGEGWLLHIPACYLGIASAARNYAINFANEYAPNSIKAPIATLPNVQRQIGEIEMELMQSRHFLYSVADKWQNQFDLREQLTPHLAAVKHSVTNSAIKIVDKAMRIVGAQSLQRTNPLSTYYRNVRAGLHNPPMDDAAINLLAQWSNLKK
ncbi:acyl-CoA dehydrogenase family protein [Peribacillus alkalitolerans]|uniref:acyl-CoA dehydrogenase family protein n=1 Tax=Peribacillus alkalitolerans TaxID=1550385 RepID=UPI0013D3C5A1|nr:acyl-CoA dehydrogenase family protein [Peribacillus alkalitolerans]